MSMLALVVACGHRPPCTVFDVSIGLTECPGRLLMCPVLFVGVVSVGSIAGPKPTLGLELGQAGWDNVRS